MNNNIYKNGTYLTNNPTWHKEDADWKTKHVLNIITRNNIIPNTICEVGCGTGDILRALQLSINCECNFIGYEISPQAYQLCLNNTNNSLQFKLADINDENDVYYDIILLIDVIEHIEDYFFFLRNIKHKSNYKIFHIPLDISIQSILRNKALTGIRKKAGHIHYFTKEVVLNLLEDLEFEVIDYFYTAPSVDLPAKSMKNLLAKLPRKLLFLLHQDSAVRIMGGYSLMVLAK